MPSSSFYVDGETYDEAVVVPNDHTASTAPSQAPSSFYPDGQQYTQADEAATDKARDQAVAAAAAALASQTAAHTSEVNAASSATSAASSATTATTQAGIASTEAGIAGTQAGISATEAAASSASATAASTSEANAATSATNAASSAAAAAASETNAHTSEVNAASSASAAATSATNAASDVATAVSNAAGTATPIVDGTADVGTSGKWAHEDHVHPVDTSRAPITQAVPVGGTTGQVLSKQSNTDNDVIWAAAAGGMSPSVYDPTGKSADAFNSANTAFTASGTGAVTRSVSSRLDDAINARDFGAKGDLKFVTGNTSITAGAAALTVGGAGFVPGDVGKSIQVPGAGASGAPLVTTISAYTSSTQVTLTANAGTTLSAASKTVTWYTDDTAALQAAATQAIATGKTLLIPRGNYAASSLSFDTATGINLIGDGAWNATILTCINTSGTASFVTFKSTFDCTVRALVFSHCSTGWINGYLLDASHSTSVDTQGLFVERCGFTSQGNNLYVARGVKLDKANLVTFDGCKFVSLLRPVTGQDDTGGSYCNVIKFLNCQFFDNVGYQFYDLGQGWHIEGCNFQPCHDGAHRLLFAGALAPWKAISLVNCSAYDATAAGTDYLLLDVGQGLSIVGGMYGGRKDLGTSTFLNATGIIQGMHMAGVYWSLFTNIAIAAVTGNKAWDLDRGNIVKTIITYVANPSNVSPTVTASLVAVIP